MYNIVKIINQIRGGIKGLEDNPITLNIGGYMPLHIEYIGEGPDNLPAIAVSHTYIQNGDLMRDPEICFQWVDIPAAGTTPARIVLSPFSYRQDGLGIFKEYRYRREDGEVMVDVRGVKDTESFCRLWSRNIRQQGFLDEAERLVSTERDHGGETRDAGHAAAAGSGETQPELPLPKTELIGWPARVETTRTILVRDNVITDPGQAAEIYRDLKTLDREKMVVICLDQDNKILGSEIVSVGTLNYNLVHPRETFKVPLLLGATQIIMIHNHPSGCPEPSDEDLSLDKRLAKGARLLGLELKHSLIVAGDRWSEYGQNTRIGERINTILIGGRKRIKEFEVRLENTRTGATILKPRDAVEVLSGLVNDGPDKSHVVYMDTRNQVIKINSVDAISPKEIIREAIVNSAASFLVCGGKEIETMEVKLLAQAGKLVGIEFMDHVVANLRDKELVKSLKQSGVMEPAAGYCKDSLQIKNVHLMKEVEGLPDLMKKYQGAQKDLENRVSGGWLTPLDKEKILRQLNSPAGAELIAKHSEQPEITVYASLCAAEDGKAEVLKKYQLPEDVQRLAAVEGARTQERGRASAGIEI